MSQFNRYRRKRPKVDASIFDSVVPSRYRVILVARTRPKKREEKSVSTFGRFLMWTSFESSPVSVKVELFSSKDLTTNVKMRVLIKI